MADTKPTKNYQQSGGFNDGDLQIAAYMFAGLAMMLNIRLSYSAAPFALLRFKLPENLFSVFVRTTSSALELWCIPSMLLGNIMEQVYNQTQEIPRVHATGIKNSELKEKATTLSSTTGDQSESELGNTHENDIKKSGNISQTGLQEKATLLATKAEDLSTQAQKLVEAAQTGNPLNEQGEALKDAAKSEDGNGGLKEKAEELALAAHSGKDAKSEAYGVIKAFDNTEKQYNLLMKAAGENKLTSDPKVIGVVKTFHEVKNSYYQMIIVYRIKNRAEAIYSAATVLQKAAEAAAKQQTTKPLLKELQGAASREMAELVENASALKEEAQQLDGARDSEIVKNYLQVVEKYNALETKEQFTAAINKNVREVTDLKDTFEDLKKSYENVLRLRVQELSQKADTLSGAATDLSGDLRSTATALANAASQDSGTGLKQKAIQLVEAINSKDGDANGKAGDVITQFDTVANAFNDLANKDEYKQKLEQNEQNNVKNVDKAYNDLKTLYDSILKFTKIKHYSEQIHGAVGTDVEKAIINFNAVVDSYKLLEPERQPIVQTEFDALQEEYSEAIYKYKFHFLTIPSMFTNWLNFLTFVILLIVFVTGGDNGHVTGYYVIMAISGFVFGINMVLVYAVDYRYLPYYMAGENSFPMVTSLILYFATSIFGNRRKYNSDYLVVVIDVSIAIFIALVASVLWTYAFYDYRTPMYGDMTPDPWPLVSPVAMVIVGMGLVYSIYPGIAPGMIVPFYLVDKIEMVLLVATAFPPVIIAILRKYKPSWSPSTNFVFPGFGGWKEYQYASQWGQPADTTVYAWIWHLFDILIPLKIGLAVIFIYSIHYRDSSISRSIVNQPKMSTFLTIVFYMCHEILLALGFPGMVANGGAGGAVLLPVQYVGALLMVFLAFYSIGYIKEYKRHDPSQWPTEGMTKWNALCYWLKMASKITNKNFKQLFTTDLRRDLLLCIQKNELI